MKFPQNKTGLPFGAYIRSTRSGLVGRVAGKSNRVRTFTEMFGVCQECGDLWTCDLVEITKDEFLRIAGRFGYSNPKPYIVALQKFDEEQK